MFCCFHNLNKNAHAIETSSQTSTSLYDLFSVAFSYSFSLCHLFFFFLVTNRLTCVAFLSEFSLCPEVTKNNITVLDLKSEREMREGQKGGEKEGKEQRNGKTAQTIQLHFRKQHKWT